MSLFGEVSEKVIKSEGWVGRTAPLEVKIEAHCAIFIAILLDSMFTFQKKSTSVSLMFEKARLHKFKSWKSILLWYKSFNFSNEINSFAIFSWLKTKNAILIRNHTFAPRVECPILAGWCNVSYRPLLSLKTNASLKCRENQKFRGMLALHNGKNILGSSIFKIHRGYGYGNFKTHAHLSLMESIVNFYFLLHYVVRNKVRTIEKFVNNKGPSI